MVDVGVTGACVLGAMMHSMAFGLGNSVTNTKN